MVSGLMNNPLRKRYKLELKDRAARYISILIIFILMVFIISSFLIVADGVSSAYNNNQIECKVEDGQFTSMVTLDSFVLEEMQQLPISLSPNYYIEEKILEDKLLRIYTLRSTMNIQTLWQGHLPQNQYEIVLDRLFAANNGLSLQDEIIINHKTYLIVGMISLPDYSALFIENTDILMDSFGFGVALVNGDTFQSYQENQVNYNYSYRYDQRDLSEEEKIEISNDMKEIFLKNQIPLKSFIAQKDNQSISFVKDDLGSDVPLIKSFLYIIQVIMTFVFTVIIANAIEEDAAVIGTLFASGYRKKELIIHYLTLPVLVVLLGSIIGNILAYTLGIPLFQGLYYNSYSLSPIQLRLHYEALLLTTLLPITILLLINTTILYFKLSLSPLKFLRRDLKKHKQTKSIKLPNFSFLTRFRIRIILQNKGNYLILFLGILFASFILLFGLCMQPTMNQYLETIKNSTVSEYQYLLKSPLDHEYTDAEKFSIQGLEIYSSMADKNFEVSFYGINEKSIFWDFSTKDLPSNSILISDGLAKKLSIRIGDTITLTNSFTLDTYHLHVYDIVSYPAGFSVFSSMESFNQRLEKEAHYFNGYFSNSPLTIPSDYLLTTITASEISSYGNQMLSIFNQMAVICSFTSIVIYFVIFYVLTKIIIDKNTQSISFMKVMGYQEKEVKRLYLKATTLVVIFSLLISLPIIYYAIRYIFIFVYAQISGYIEPYITTTVFIAIFALGLLTYSCINWIHTKRIQKINMGEALKNRE